MVKQQFPKNHRLHKLFNKNNVKVSYSCLPNVSSIISSHNKRILQDHQLKSEPGCNCRYKDQCPLNNKCLDKNVIYLCHVKESINDEGQYYIGLTSQTFKQRWGGHKNSFKYEEKENSTELSKYIWSIQRRGVTPILSWSVIDHAQPYNPVTKKCNLCITEKYHIITSKLKLINKKSELVSTCLHSRGHLLKHFRALTAGVT